MRDLVVRSLSALVTALLMVLSISGLAGQKTAQSGPARVFSIQDVITLAKQGSPESVIAAVDRSGPFVQVFTKEDLDLLTNSGIDQAVVVHVMHTQLGKRETLRQLRELYFPITEGAAWTYRFRINGDLIIPYSDLLRKAQTLSPPFTASASRLTTFRVDKRVSASGSDSYPISVSNNLLEPYPWSPNPNLSSEEIQILRETLYANYKSTYLWRLAEDPRKPETDDYNLRVSEVVTMSFGGEMLPRKDVTFERDLFTLPAISFQTATTHSKAGDWVTTYAKATDRVQTPAGNFANCIVKTDVITTKVLGELTTSSYYCPKVGLVKQQQNGSVTTVGYVMELAQYQQAGAKTAPPQ
jgi:hypothetical protein